MTPLPSLVFGFLIATLYGSLFHVWKGGSLLRLLADIVLAWAGFWGGHALAVSQGWQWGTLGVLHLGAASAGSAAFLLAGHLLAPPADETPS